MAIALDALVGALAAAAVSVSSLDGTLRFLGASGPSTPVIATNLAYLILDIGLLVAVVALVASYRWRPPFNMAVLGLGVVLWALADAVFLYQVAVGSFRPGSVLSPVTLASSVVIAGAAWFPRPQRPHRGRSLLPELATPTLFVLICVTLLVLGTQRPVPHLAVALATSGLLVAVVRAALSFRLVAVVTRLRHAQELARIGEFELDPDGRTNWSPMVYEILGVEPVRTAVGPSIFEQLVHPEDRAWAHHQELEARPDGHLDLTCRIVRPDGGIRVVHLLGEARLGSNGSWLGWQGTIQDVTEQDRRRQERSQLLQRIVTSADDERQRLAEHLHDEAVQLLSAAVLRLDLVDADPAAADRVHEPLAQATASLRTTITELAPPTLEARTFASAVRSYVDRTLGSDGIEVTIDVRIDADLDAPRALSTSYRVTQEALANVRRHAAARRVQVTILTEDGMLHGSVVDDGVGIGPRAVEEAAARPGHLGLRLVVERVEAAHGTVSVEADAGGSGTRVAWTLPV